MHKPYVGEEKKPQKAFRFLRPFLVAHLHRHALYVIYAEPRQLLHLQSAVALIRRLDDKAERISLKIDQVLLGKPRRGLGGTHQPLGVDSNEARKATVILNKCRRPSASTV